MLPDSTTFDYEGDYFYFNNGNAERFPIRGGNWNNGANAGLFYTNLNNPRSNSNWNIGFRSALPLCRTVGRKSYGIAHGA